MGVKSKKIDSQSVRKRGNPTPCPICGVIISNSYGLSCHLRRHSNDRPFKCDQCSASFILVTELQRHKIKHVTVRPYKCSICPKGFKEARTLRAHIDSHGINEYKCKYCEAKFKSSTDCSKHERNIHGSNNLKCKYCYKTFSENKYKEQHEDRVHNKKVLPKKLDKGAKPRKDAHQLRAVDVNFKFYPCKICPERFRYRRDQLSHYQANHKEEFENTFKECKICEKILTTEYFASHMQAHQGILPFECKICDYKTNRKSDLRNHTLIHTKEYPFKCSHCQKSFIKKGFALLCEKKHTGEKDVKCKLCDMTFFSIMELRIHENNKHEPKQCQICGYKTSNRYTFYKHKACHRQKHKQNKNKCKMCDKCGKLFPTNKSLFTHVQRHLAHKSMDEYLKKKICAYCNYQSDSGNDMFNHCLEYHPSKVNKCEICGYETLNLKHFCSHMKNHLQKSGEELYVYAGLNETRNRNKNFVFIECSFCGFLSYNKESMSQHVDIHNKMLKNISNKCFLKYIHNLNETKNKYEVDGEGKPLFHVKIPNSQIEQQAKVENVTKRDSDHKDDIQLLDNLVLEEYEKNHPPLRDLNFDQGKNIEKGHDIKDETNFEIKKVNLQQNLKSPINTSNSKESTGIADKEVDIDSLKDKLQKINGQYFLSLEDLCSLIKKEDL